MFNSGQAGLAWTFDCDQPKEQDICKINNVNFIVFKKYLITKLDQTFFFLFGLYDMRNNIMLGKEDSRVKCVLCSSTSSAVICSGQESLLVLGVTDRQIRILRERKHRINTPRGKKENFLEMNSSEKEREGGREKESEKVKRRMNIVRKEKEGTNSKK